MDLGAPIDSGAPRAGFDQGEHGAGVGLSGSHGQVSSQNTQQGLLATDERSGFNSGLGGEHASGGIPKGFSGTESTPIADKFMGGATGGSTLDSYGASGQTGTGTGYDENPVSGAYSGGATRDALGGESHAITTGAGVGVLGENLRSGTGEHHSHHHHHHRHHEAGAGNARSAATAGTAAGAAAAVGEETATGGTGTGVGPSGGSGGHYSSNENSGKDASNTTGHYGQTESDETRGQPLSNPDELDTGGRHSLVFDDASGKYLHRHEVDGSKLEV